MDIRRNPPAYNNKYYLKTTYGGYNKCILIEDNGMCIPNCVGYAYGRFMECANKTTCNLPTCDAYLWYGYNDGYTRGGIAKQGAIICYSGGWENKGHVAFVEEVNSDGSILISQSSYGGTRWESLTLYPPYTQYGLTVQGFIYNPYIDDTPTNIKMYGIDVSQHNDLSLDITKYDFVIIRACWGTNVDDKALQWKEKCEQHGIPYGVYLYSYSLSVQDGIDEANYICDLVKDWNIQMGIWIDMENDSYKQTHGSWTPYLCTEVCKVFCETVQARGYYTGIYASQSVFGTYINCDNFDKWVAAWGTNDGTIQRDTSYMGTLLQYTSKDNEHFYTIYDEYGNPIGEEMTGLDKNVSYCDLEHYKSYPVIIPSEDEQDDQDHKQDEIIVPSIDDDYLFKMSNKVYDFLNWVVHITPLFITLYIALSNIWNWHYTEPIVATISAIVVFISSILKQSTIGYTKKDGGNNG